MPILDGKKRREYQRLYHLRTWDKRKIRHKFLKQKREKDLVIWLKRYKNGKICEICGESYEGCLDFHHRNSKEKSRAISDLVAKGYGKTTILSEIMKCAVLCKNCHAKVHDRII